MRGGKRLNKKHIIPKPIRVKNWPKAPKIPIPIKIPQKEKEPAK